ncbi:phage portal protein [Campylobacter hyointestinalis]|uniref:phage portal protein n=1 Tax=Campylobacter hyointestinalis TaxID=198 RepID=UPI0007277A50|nr:phage portal protein [Campylobacter hyointestinalis]CUU72121.1 phage portal protein%2C lambda family [Campylobacter hyointestinalis subsp. hyointestinalis]
MFRFMKPKSEPAPKKQKRKINFFNWRSTNPSLVKQNETYKLAINSDPDNANKILRSQARTISVSNSLASGFFEMLTSEILGEQGLILDVTSGDPVTDKKIEDKYFKWESECCPYGVYDFEDIEEMAIISFYRDGEVFIRLHRNDTLKIELIDANLIDNNYTNEAKNIKCGIERAKDSLRPIFYYIRKDDRELLKVPADQMLHIKKPLIPQQFRGISKMASSIIDIEDKDRLRTSELDRATLASKITGFFIRKNDDNIGFDEEDDQALEGLTLPTKAEVGKMSVLDEDMDVKFVESHAPSNIEYYLKSTDREVARSLGVSYHTYTGDLREVNYSSIRQGTTSERRNFRRFQGFLRRKFHAPIFKAWCECELLNGGITPSEYKKVISNFTFKPQGWEYIDPTKEVNANKVAIDSGFKSITEVLREKGIEHDNFISDLNKDLEIVELLSKIKQIKEVKP